MTRRALRWAWLAIVVAASVYLRVWLSTFTPRFDPDDETGYYRTESAYQYRYARMVALGLPLPALDAPAQYPEGVQAARELTPTMELCTGWAYRLLPVTIDFRWFVILWVAVVSSLSIVPLYFLAVLLTGEPWAALGAAAVYGLSWAAISNVVATYTLESFALPWIYGGLAFFAAALAPGSGAPRRRAWAAASGLALAVALSSWHFTRFYLLSFFAAAAWAAWPARREESPLGRLREALGIVALCALGAGLAVPSLRESAFILSPAMIASAGLWLTLAFPRRAAPIAAAALVAVVVRGLAASDSGAYGHVYALLFDKLRFGLSKPVDPARLSPEARAIWNGPGNSPTAAFLAFCLAPLAAIIVPRAAAPWSREKAGQEPLLARLLDALLVFYAAGALLVLRLTPVFAFFLCLGALRLPRPWLRGRALALFLAALAGLEAFKSLAPASRLNPFMRLSAAVTREELHPTTSFEAELGVTRWLRVHGGPDKPVLASIAFSASFLTYAGSPILLHPKFEAPGIRRKTAEFLDALYSDEAAFARFCERYGARLVVFSVNEGLDQTPEGPLYQSGRTELRADSAAALFQFHPERLKRFELAYQNDGFRVYAFGRGLDPPVAGPAPAIYDPAQFRARTLPDGALALDVGAALRRLEESKRQLFLARLMSALGRRDEALAAYERAFKAWPPDESSRRDYKALRRPS